MRNKQTILIEQLNNKLQAFSETKNITIPEKGWIQTIRISLNMKMVQLGKKLNITRQGVKSIEESEANGTITINSIKDVADALGFQLVYALVPKNGTINDLIETKAESLARKIVLRTHQNMKLEDQAIDEDKIEKSIIELADDLKREMKKSLWD